MLIDTDVIDLPDGPPAGSPYGELRALREPGRLALSARSLLTAPRGDGHVVLVVPGFRTDDRATAPLRAFLRRLGYDARGWGFGMNNGDPMADRDRLATLVRDLAERHGAISLIGWSLGGVIVREVARDLPHEVRSVVMFGSPIVGGPLNTIAVRAFDPAEAAQAAAELEHLDSERPVSVPVTSIFSRRDRIVNWKACIDRRSTRAANIEVNSSHFGLLIDPDVWLAVARALVDTGPPTANHPAG